jgi:hypothetical protein
MRRCTSSGKQLAIVVSPLREVIHAAGWIIPAFGWLISSFMKPKRFSPSPSNLAPSGSLGLDSDPRFRLGPHKRTLRKSGPAYHCREPSVRPDDAPVERDRIGYIPEVEPTFLPML